MKTKNKSIEVQETEYQFLKSQNEKLKLQNKQLYNELKKIKQSHSRQNFDIYDSLCGAIIQFDRSNYAKEVQEC